MNSPADDLQRRLSDLQRDQVERRPIRQLTQTELDELRAVKLLAAATFGNYGVVEVRWGEGFEMLVGWKAKPNDGSAAWRRLPSKLPFRGASHRELVAQIRIWKARR